jgi:hypothetical protein
MGRILLLDTGCDRAFIIGRLDRRLASNVFCVVLMRRLILGCRYFLRKAHSLCRRRCRSRSYSSRSSAAIACLRRTSLEFGFQMRLDGHAETLHCSANVGRQRLVLADSTLFRESCLALFTTVSMRASRWVERINSHLSHMEVSQQGSLTAFTATRLQRPQRSFAGISSGTRVLDKSACVQARVDVEDIPGEI